LADKRNAMLGYTYEFCIFTNLEPGALSMRDRFDNDAAPAAD